MMCIFALQYLFGRAVMCAGRFSPLEEEKVDIIIAFGQEVAQHTCWVATTDLVG